jgi:hypothetical protein
MSTTPTIEEVTGYVATCSCGWKGNPTASQEDAGLQGPDHQEDHYINGEKGQTQDVVTVTGYVASDGSWTGGWAMSREDADAQQAAHQAELAAAVVAEGSGS